MSLERIHWESECLGKEGKKRDFLVCFINKTNHEEF